SSVRIAKLIPPHGTKTILESRNLMGVQKVGPWEEGDEARLCCFDQSLGCIRACCLLGLPQRLERRSTAVHQRLRSCRLYDGYCAMGVAGMAIVAAHKDTADPEAWAIVDGKLYLTHTKRTMEERWRPKMAENIKRADQNWSSVARQGEPDIVGPPCRN